MEEVANSVLVVDDSPEQIRFISEVLKQEECRILAAISCEQAFQILEHHRPNLILLDIVMPGMDGLTFCKIIKSKEDLKDIPVIFATAYHDPNYLASCFEAGGCDYVVKPFFKQELLERVKVRIRLSQKRIELQNAYAELDAFCYTLSHDIRSPLYVLKQLSELLEQEVEEENKAEIKEICSMISEKAERTAAMAEGLHKFSKALYEEMSYERVNMKQMFQEVYDGLMLLEGDRNVVMQMEEVPDVWADPVLMRLVILNILGNALKFTSHLPETRIHIYAEKSSKGITYHVKDNGIGIEEKYAKDVFHVFRRLHGEEYKGDGVGLATVKRVVERHHGTVEIKGRPNEGACVTFTLPDTKKVE